MISQLLCPQDKVGKSPLEVSQSAHPLSPPILHRRKPKPLGVRGSPRLSCFFIASHTQRDVFQLQPDYGGFKPEGPTLP